MPADFHDANQLPAIGVQITPTVYVTPGVLCTATNTSGPSGLASVTAQYTTQSNPGRDNGAGFGLNTITSREQNLAVVGPMYLSPGNTAGMCPNQQTIATGGGP
jgi:hypothetical protein